MDIVNKIAPERVRKITSDDQPWFTEPLKVLDRKRRREFHKNRRSQRYLNSKMNSNLNAQKLKRSFIKT